MSTTIKALENQLILLGNELQALERHEQPTRSQEARLTEVRQQMAETKRELVLIHSSDQGNLIPANGDTPEQARLRAASAEDQGRTMSDILGGPSAGNRDRARRVVDEAHRSGSLPDHAAEAATRLVNDDRPIQGGIAQRWAIATGDPAYYRAFAHLLANPERGHVMWSPEEQEAFRAVEHLRAEMRAMSLTDSAGGFMVPLTLDPAIMLTSAGSINPLRRISRVVQTSTNQWQGVTSAGVTAEWKAEAGQVADASPTLDDAPIPVHFGDAFVPYSFEVGMDAINFLPELQKLLADAADQLQATAFTTGSGNGQPKGIITALAGTAAEINSIGSEALVPADAFALQNGLGARFSGDARFMSHIAVANVFRQFETTNGALQFPELRESPPHLLGKPWLENSNMDGSINAAATANNYVMVYGDFGRGFVIVDRIGTTLELVPHIPGANGRPTGQRGALLWFRTGSDCVHPNAFKMLDVPTTA